MLFCGLVTLIQLIYNPGADTRLQTGNYEVCPASGLSLTLFLGSFSFCLLYFCQGECAASCFSELTPSHLYFIETVFSKAFAVSSELSPSAFSQSPSTSLLPDTEHTLTSSFSVTALFRVSSCVCKYTLFVFMCVP